MLGFFDNIDNGAAELVATHKEAIGDLTTVLIVFFGIVVFVIAVKAIIKFKKNTRTEAVRDMVIRKL